MVMPLGCHDCKFNKHNICGHPLTVKKYGKLANVSMSLGDPELCGTMFCYPSGNHYVDSFFPKLLELSWHVEWSPFWQIGSVLIALVIILVVI